MIHVPSLLQHFCDAVWEIDTDRNQVYIYHDGMHPELRGRWLPYDPIDKLYREKYVYVLDQSIWEEYLSPEHLRQFATGQRQEDHFQIRFESPDTGKQWHDVHFQRLENGHLLLASRDIRDALRNDIIAQAVELEYDYVCCIDVATGGYVLYYSDSENTVVPQDSSDSYHRTLEKFNRENVVPEESDAITAKMQLPVVQELLKKDEEYVLYATTIEFGQIAYKKLRFTYRDEAKTQILLTRTDISELVKAQKLRQKEEQLRLEYLEHMPMAFCSTQVLVDENGKPYDFLFTYCNRAHEVLEGVGRGELIGKRFYEFFGETDPTWLQYYYETAYQGINHVIRRYSPEIGKHLLIYTFQSELGHCECVLLDVSEEYFLAQELENSRENMRRVLEATTDLVFQYRPETEELILNRPGEDQAMSRHTLEQRLRNEELVHSEDWETLHDTFRKIKLGEHNVSATIRMRSSETEKWSWCRVTLFDFQDGATHQRRVLGFLQNIDQDRSREEEFRRLAQTDSLTQLLNSGAGKEKIAQSLAKKDRNEEGSHALFVMDMDNFKTINDTQGHQAGDQVLMEFARVLRKTFRSEDVIYRLGGDEFVVYIDKVYDPDRSMEVILNRLHQNMEKAREEMPLLRCSVGVFVTNESHPFETLYQRADQALYETKNSRKGFYTIYKETHQ